MTEEFYKESLPNPLKFYYLILKCFDLQGETPDTIIGRVYVDDPDDWDLPDKYFAWLGNAQHPNFNLDSANGRITMYQGTPSGFYGLHFTVRFLQYVKFSF